MEPKFLFNSSLADNEVLNDLPIRRIVSYMLARTSACQKSAKTNGAKKFGEYIQ